MAMAPVRNLTILLSFVGLLKTNAATYEGDKLSDTEKTALNVITLLLPVLDALVANQKDETLSIHETKINRLQVGVRKN